MKYIGLLLIAVAGTGAGLYASHRLHRRVAVLRQLEQVWEHLLRRLTYTALPMAQLWREMAADEGLSACVLVRDTAAALEKAPFSAAFARAVELSVQQGLLHKEEEEVLRAFGRECGQYDLSRQTAQLKACLARLGELRLTAREVAANRGQIYRVSGVAGGVALALFLL